MKYKFLFLFVALVATTVLWASNVITYTATSKLLETTSSYSGGLHTNAFNIAILSHTFSNGAGTITFAGEVTTIGEWAFRDCDNLSSITIPHSVITIGSRAFHGCNGLTSITLPNSVTTIDGWAFYNCSGLTSITIPASVTTIGEMAFCDCIGLTSVTIGYSVTTIGSSAFSGCNNITSVTWNAMNSNAYNYGSQVETFAFGDGVKIIPDGLCKNMNLTSVIIPNSVTTIGSNAFYNCMGLTSVTIGNSVTSIGDYAFSLCRNLTSVTIPNSVTTIGDMVFYFSGLTSITCEAATPPSCGSNCFYSVTKSIPVYVPAKSIDAYKQANGWKDFTNILPIGIDSTGLEDLTINKKIGNKFLFGNQLYIRRGKEIYNASGQKVK